MITLKQFLAESPQYIYKMHWDFIEKNPDQVKTFIDSLGKPFMKINGVNIHKQRLGIGTRIIGVIENRIAYAMEYTIPLEGIAIQVKLWRNRDIAQSKDIPSKIVFDHILKENLTILTDKEQTKAARDFWVRLFKQAVNRGFKIGYINVRTSGVTNFPNGDNLDKWIKQHQSKIWGNNPDYANIHGFISNRGL